MAQTARKKPLPSTGDDRKGTTEWMHDLTPTLSDEAMFDKDGHIQPLQVWPTDSEARAPKSTLKLVRTEKEGTTSEK